MTKKSTSLHMLQLASGLALSILIHLPQSAYAEKCVLHIYREACSDKTKDESFAKCGGKQECDKELEASSEKDCAKKALKECENARLEITKLKKITAKFGTDQKPLENSKQFCAEDRPDFNKCSK